MGFTLYELTNAYNNVLTLIEEGATPEEMELTLANIEDEIENKADSYAVIIKTLEAHKKMLAEEEKRLYSKRKNLEGNIDRLKRNLENSMELVGKKKFKTDKFSFGIQKNPMSANILDESKVPEKYKKVIEAINIDKKSMIADFKDNGELIDGVEFIQSESLRIR